MTGESAEFRGGPMDGLTEVVVQPTPLKTFASPGIGAAEMVRMADDATPHTDDGPSIREYAYQRTDKLNQQGARIYTYLGERSRK